LSDCLVLYNKIVHVEALEELRINGSCWSSVTFLDYLRRYKKCNRILTNQW
jgi:hypothetical protein